MRPADTRRVTEWEGLACDQPDVGDVATCAPEDCPQGAVCRSGGEGGGVCTSFDVDIWCDGEGEVAGYGVCLCPEDAGTDVMLGDECS